ncbi:hypothetical protein [Limimaricola cinnabarinus]|uniref:Oxidoreductase molybdopterin-binding domain-containing protein n=1 Tax=Limimaricola cinnabarinus LL-001 TaxID=1337093 RepID=U3A8Z4_9RHOB|nr:hypothetical protein [Limimaricola cinnabarinus]GAD54149.1 hypothetical protein MBELCI_0201 [Limimaricola cinnabarinus LL-001]
MQMVYAGAIVGLTFTGLALVGWNMPMFSNAEHEATVTEVPRPAAAGSSATEPGVLRIGRGDEGAVRFDLQDLDALPQLVFETGTIWTDGVSTFSGVPVAALLEKAGLEKTLEQPDATLELIALNDYRVRIPMDEIGPELPIIATRIDGKTVPVRDKGPYWLVYPYDSDPRFRTEDVYARSIWQLAKMVVIE